MSESFEILYKAMYWDVLQSCWDYTSAVKLNQSFLMHMQISYPIWPLWITLSRNAICKKLYHIMHLIPVVCGFIVRTVKNSYKIWPMFIKRTNVAMTIARSLSNFLCISRQTFSWMTKHLLQRQATRIRSYLTKQTKQLK